MNVRKHSGARHALVRLASTNEKWSLTVEDDGKGFPFEGRYNQKQMEEAGKRPDDHSGTGRFDRRRTHGRINSRAGYTRLEVTVPRNGEVPHEL